MFQQRLKDLREAASEGTRAQHTLFCCLSNNLGGSFSNRDNVRAPNQFRRESQPQHLKR